MQLGFVTAILPDYTLEQILKLAAEIGYDCVEVMCWPKEGASRRYAGVSHLDVANFTEIDAAAVLQLTNKYGVAISALGYYPNALSNDPNEAETAVEHIKNVIKASSLLGLKQMNTFIGRDHTKSVDDNWPAFLATWKPLIEMGEQYDVKIGIENCPMSFGKNEWPGGKNLKTTPAIWRRMYEDIPSDYFGLNFDPSHFIFQQMDYLKPLREFKNRLFHSHAKDMRVDHGKLDQVGILAHPEEYHTPKLPGMGDVNWGQFFGVLTDIDYDGAVCVEVEDRAFEGSTALRIRSLRQSLVYLRQFIQQ
jgi:sugar phosphate isomerase/epimerase